MLSIILAQQVEITCQIGYKFNNQQYQSCYKASQIANTKLVLEPQFPQATDNVSTTIFQYGHLIMNTNIQVTYSQNVGSFAFFGATTTNKIQDSSFTFQTENIGQINGISESISVSNTSSNVIGNAYSLTLGAYSNISLDRYTDKSQFVSNQSSMTGAIYAVFNISNSYLYQSYDSTTSSALISLYGNSTARITIQNSIIRALSTSNIIDNYGFVKVLNQGAQLVIQELEGYLSGAYISLSQRGIQQNAFTQEIIQISVDSDSTTIIQDQYNYNNTYISLGNYQVNSQDSNIQLFNQRPIYYGINIQESYFTVTGSSFSLITNTIDQATVIQNLICNLDLTSNTSKFAGIGINASVGLNIKNCTYNGVVNVSGSGFLLFETTTAQIIIENLTTNIEMIFSEASYGLIKNVQGGVTIDGWNCNSSMQVSGNVLVTSSLMFDSVTGGQSSIQNVNGIYGGYIDELICISDTCPIKNTELNISIRSITDIYYDYTTYDYVNYTYYYVYYPFYEYQSYIGRLNGTNVTMDNLSVSREGFILNGLGDAKIVQNVQLNAHAYNNYSSSYYETQNYIGGIAGRSKQQSSYTIKNVVMNLTFSSYKSEIGEIGGLFGVLNQTATIVNVTEMSNLEGGTSDVGGLIAYLDSASVEMENINITGKYVSGSGCACVIAIITSQSTTNLINCSIDAEMSSMSGYSGPVYGLNNGTFNQMNVNNIDLTSNSIFNDCPVGSGLTNESLEQICPEKSDNMNVEISSFICDQSVSSNTYHQSFTYCYAFSSSSNVNNTNIQITMQSLGSDYYNKSLFAVKESYTNLSLIINTTNLSVVSDSYGFSFLQSIIDDTTISITNVLIQSSAYGRNYGSFGGLTQCFSSNATVSNITINLDRIYQYYGAGIAYQLRAQSATFENINLNYSCDGTSMSDTAGLFYSITNVDYNLTINNAQINATQIGYNDMRLFIYSVSSTYCSYTFQNINSTIQQQNTSYEALVLYTINGSTMQFNNCSFDINITDSSSLGGILYNNYISGLTSYINVNMTGKLVCTAYSSYSSYYVGGLEAYLSYFGQRQLQNVTLDDYEILGNYYVGGLFAYVSAQVTINISNTNISVSLGAYSSSSYSQYMGAFVGYASSSYSATLNINTSKFTNSNNNQDVECLLGGGSMNINIDDEDSTCPAQLAQLNITDSPTFSQNYYSYGYYGFTNGNHSCYWFTNDQVNDTLLNFNNSYSGSCGNQSGGSILSFFSPDYSPNIINNLHTTGTLYAQSYWHVSIVVAPFSSLYDDTTYTNVVLAHTNIEQHADYEFSMYGMIYQVEAGYNVSFIGCQNNVIHNHTGDTYKSYATGFVNYAYDSFNIENCSSSYIVNEKSNNTGSNVTEKYAVGRNIYSGCNSTNFESNYTLGQC